MKPLDARFGSVTVQDCIKTLSSPAQEALASLIASYDLRVVATNIDVEKAKPVDHGPTYDELLDNEALKLEAEMRGYTLFAAATKHAPAREVEMHASLLMDVHTHLMKTAHFGCSFNK